MKPRSATLIAASLALIASVVGYRIAHPHVTVKLNNIPLKEETLFSIPHAGKIPIQPSIDGVSGLDRDRTWIKLEIPSAISISHPLWTEQPSTKPNTRALMAHPAPPTISDVPAFLFPEIGWQPGMRDIFDLLLTVGVESNHLATLHITCVVHPGFSALTVHYGKEAKRRIDGILAKTYDIPARAWDK